MRDHIATRLTGFVVVSVLAGPLRGEDCGFVNITGNNATDAAVGEAQLLVQITDIGSDQVLFTFLNTGPEASSITDVYFDDGALLGIAFIDDSDPSVSFSQLAAPGNLPGGELLDPPFEVTGGFSADSDPAVVQNGVNPGESLGIGFDLLTGKTFDDVLISLSDGSLRIGIHVQGFDDGGSESFVNGDCGGECIENIDCDDGNLCTTDICSGGVCVSDAAAGDGTPCDDGLFCNEGETCLAGSCQGGSPRDCDDGEACTDDSCDESGDVCVNDGAVNEGLACDTGLFCTEGGTCLAGSCQAGTPRDCDDGEPCTADSCDEATDTCIHDSAPLDGTVCDDGLFCNEGETCLAGSCQGGSARDCDDGEQCTVDSCAEADDICTNDAAAAEGNACDDGNVCTNGEGCFAGECASGAPVDCSQLNDQCLAGVCNTLTGDCEAQPANEGVACDDQILCTIDDACTSGVCAGVINDCSDGSTCTDDLCDETNPLAGPDGCVSTINSLPPFAEGVGSRTIEVSAQFSPTDHPVALELRSPNFECLVKWLVPSGPGTAALDDVPFFQSPTDWGTLFVSGGDIVPSANNNPVEYHIRASCGQDDLGEHTFTNDPFDNPAGIAVTFLWGDVNNDSAVDLDDILCITAGFGGDFTTCSLQNLDLFPCEPNGFIDLDDILVVIDAFAGKPFPCAIPCGGACCLDLPGTECELLPPDQCAELGGSYLGDGSLCLPNPCGAEGLVGGPVGFGDIALSALVTVVVRQDTGLPKDLFAVDLFISGVVDLRGYQVAVDVRGGISGRLDPVDLTVDMARDDYVFASAQSFFATGFDQQRLAGVRLTGGVTTQGPGYLGTFVYRATSDASGDFEVSLRTWNDTMLRDSNEQVIPFVAGPAAWIKVEQNAPGRGAFLAGY